MTPNDFVKMLDSNINDYLAPGILRIVCIPENKTLLLSVFSCYFEGKFFFQDLEEGVCPLCPNEEFLKDYQKYGPTNEHGEPNFTIDIERCDWDFIDNPREDFENFRKQWQGNLY